MMSEGSGHNFSEIYLHVNWHCSNDDPMIRPEIRDRLYEIIEEYCPKSKAFTSRSSAVHRTMFIWCFRWSLSFF